MDQCRWITTLITTAVGWLLLVPVIFIGFMVLARKPAIRLSFLFMLGSAAILLPVRSIEVVGGLTYHVDDNYSASI